MPDLAFVHPLLVNNPLPAGGLQAAVRTAATAGARLDACLQAVAGAVHPPGSSELPGQADAWRRTFRPMLYNGIDDVAAYADRMFRELGPMTAAAPFAATDAAACATLAARVQVLKLAAEAGAATARQAAQALARFQDRLAGAASAEALAAVPPAALGVLASQKALEQGWRQLARGFDQLLATLRAGTLNSALLAAQLDAASASWGELASHLRTPGGAPGQPPPAASAPQPAQPALRSVSAFRHADVKAGAEAVAAVIGLLDTLAAGIVQLPSPGPASAPLVGRHIDAVRVRAHAWQDAVRPALVASLLALRQFGEEVVEQDAPHLHGALGRAGLADGDSRHAAAWMAGAVGDRLVRLERRFGAAARALDEHLGAMARASAELEGDTAAVALRLQDGQARIRALVSLAGSLQARLASPAAHRLRRWLPARLAALAWAGPGSARARLAGVARELNAVRAEQAAAMMDAASLQELVPALSSYLTAVDRAGAGISAVLAGARTLQQQLAELRTALLAGQASAAAAAAQLQAALADWRAIARAAGRLPPSRP